MSEELLHEETQNEGTPVTMADLEEHFDDANPWNVVKSYMEKGTVLPVKVEGFANRGAIAIDEGAVMTFLLIADTFAGMVADACTGPHVVHGPYDRFA